MCCSSFEGDLLCFLFVVLSVSFSFEHVKELGKCSSNASSVVLPWIPWWCDIILHHHVTHLRNFCLWSEVKLTGSWKQNRAEQKHIELCWLRDVWADQSEQTGYSRAESLKKQGAACKCVKWCTFLNPPGCTDTWLGLPPLSLCSHHWWLFIKNLIVFILKYW